MRLQQNLTLIFLIIILLSAIFSINTLDIISVPTNQENYSAGKEIKVNTHQLPQNENRVNIEIIWNGSDKLNLKKIINEFPSKVYLSLRSFGSKNEGDQDSFLTVPLAKNNKAELLSFIDEVKPAQRSPIGLNLIKAGEDLKEINGERHIILITNGQDSGKIMPSSVIEKLTKDNIKTSIIQTGEINKVNQLQLKSLSELGHGKYFTYFEEDNVVPTINLN